MPLSKKTLVVIVSYNGAFHLSKCLEKSYTESSDIDFMVIDNASTDGTLDFIKKNYPAVRLVENEKNIGFGAANNIGLRYAIDKSYDFIYLLNQDAWINPNSLSKLIKIADSNKEYGIISPLQVYPGETKIDHNFSNNLSKELKDDYLLNFENKKEIYCITGKTLQAAHWLVPVSALNKVGGFSPSFFHWGEDTNLCRRMEYHGFKLGIAPSIRGIHNRENRKEPRYKNNALEYVNLVNILSDPKLSVSLMTRLFIINLLTGLCNTPRNFFPLVIKTFKNFHKILKNRDRTLRKDGAFLID